MGQKGGLASLVKNLNCHCTVLAFWPIGLVESIVTVLDTHGCGMSKIKEGLLNGIAYKLYHNFCSYPCQLLNLDEHNSHVLEGYASKPSLILDMLQP